MDPVKQDITIASACMRVYRRLFLPEDTIAVIPHGGYHFRYRHSKEAMRWIKWLSHERGVRIQHAENGGEVEVPVANGQLFRVDGLVTGTKHIIEYHGTAPLSPCLLTGTTVFSLQAAPTTAVPSASRGGTR